MIKKFYLLLIPVLICSAALKADGDSPTVAEEEDVPASEESAASESLEPAEQSAEISEAEIIETIGYWTAQGGGVPMMKLDDSEIEALLTGLIGGLTGDKKLEDFSEESVTEAINELNTRLKAIDGGAEEIPAVSKDALQKIGFIIFMRSGLMQLGFAAEDVDLIKKGFIAAASTAEPDPELKAKLPAVQGYIKDRFEAMKAKTALEAEKMAALTRKKNREDRKASRSMEH